MYGRWPIWVLTGKTAGFMTVTNVGVMLKLVVDRIISGEGESTLLSLPEHVMEVRKLCQLDSSDLYDIEQIAAHDPAFCGYLLQLANSPLYGVGKQECQRLVDAIRRLGLHAVGETALVFAMRQLHQARGVSTVVLNQMKTNWQKGWDLGRRATELYWQHRHQGSGDARRIDVSDVVTAGVLTRVGHLAVYTAAAVLERKDRAFTAEQLADIADELNPLVLPALLEHWRVGADYARYLLQPPPPAAALHHSDYLWAARLQEVMGQAELTELEPAWRPVYQRLVRLGLIDDEIVIAEPR